VSDGAGLERPILAVVAGRAGPAWTLGHMDPREPGSEASRL
jgi:hypothetical protein